jgi:hypothetical protein
MKDKLLEQTPVGLVSEQYGKCFGRFTDSMESGPTPIGELLLLGMMDELHNELMRLRKRVSELEGNTFKSA